VGLLDDILHALDRIPIWKRLQGSPSEVDALKARIVELEENRSCPPMSAVIVANAL
jgi:hypothetical protein